MTNVSAWGDEPGPLDRRITVTLFRDVAAKTATARPMTVRELGQLVQGTVAASRERLPLAKLATFGDKRSDRNSLRHDANMLTVTGVELDYDGELHPARLAAARLRQAGIAALVVASPSSRPDAPRWRIWAPFSRPLPPVERSQMAGRIAGLFLPDVVFDGASWTLSQAYYVGSVTGTTDQQIHLIEGGFVDLRSDLDAGACAKPEQKGAGKPNGTGGERPSYQFDPGFDPDHEPADEAALINAIASGNSSHDAAVALSGVWAAQGPSAGEIRAWLCEAYAQRPADGRDDGWHKAVVDIPRLVDWVLDKEGAKATGGHTARATTHLGWPEPDLAVLRLNRRAPPALPLDVFGPYWAPWLEDAAKAAAAPADYCAAALLSTASALIGNARWAAATPAWWEPPHLWCAPIGDSGDGKSPAGDTLFRDVVPVIERRMARDFPDRHREWQQGAKVAGERHAEWEAAVREAVKGGTPPPLDSEAPEEPLMPVLAMMDITHEKVASLLATSAPKGCLMRRDELAGWLLGMNSYSDAARPFWIEAYGGRRYRVDRVKSNRPIIVEYLAVAWHGGIQPDRLAQVMRDADDGLLSRFMWFWPDSVTFRLGTSTPDIDRVVAQLDRLRLLEMAPGFTPDDPLHPIVVMLHETARPTIEAFGQAMQAQQRFAGGLMRSAFGKARGLALRLSLVLEFLWWASDDGRYEPPLVISKAAFEAAVRFVADYAMPMAERTFGDAGAPVPEQDATTLARWITKERPAEVHTVHLCRKVRLPGLRDAKAAHAAAAVLIDAGWLRPLPSGGFQARARSGYTVNPKLWEVLP